jgi:RHS repeat-associated protein
MKVGIEGGTNWVAEYYEATVVSAVDYYPFGSSMAGRKYNDDSYRYGFNGMEKDDEMKGNGNSYDFGARLYDSRIGKWLAVDPLAAEYPNLSPYNFVANTPIQAIDPDGRLIIFVNGRREGANPWRGRDYYGDHSGIYKKGENETLTKYWQTDKNSIGNAVNMAWHFENRIGDENVCFTSGSAGPMSKAKRSKAGSVLWGRSTSRYDLGMDKGEQFHKDVQAGKIKLEDGETIKIVTHSQGGAHGAGMAAKLIELGYDVEVIYNITPHQPTEFENPTGPRTVQYSHPDDAVASTRHPLLRSVRKVSDYFNGSSTMGKIENIDEYLDANIFGEGNIYDKIEPNNQLPTGNAGGHWVNDHEYIMDITEGQDGYVAPREEKPKTKE